MLQEPAVFHAFEVSRQVTNEAHSFREFIRFANISSGFPILVSHISPKANVLTLVAPHFSDRLPSENWMILDDNRQLAVVHPADRPFYLTRLSPDEIERLSLTESTSDPYEELWKDFSPQLPSKSVPIPTVSVRICRSTTGIICRNLKIFRVLEFFPAVPCSAQTQYSLLSGYQSEQSNFRPGRSFRFPSGWPHR